MKPKQQETSRYDRTKRRRSLRRGKERGAWVFIPAAELRNAGLDPDAAAPDYRLAGTQVRGHRVIVNLYPAEGGMT